MQIAFKYKDNSILQRPEKFYYRIGLFLEDQLVKNVVGRFYNADHSDLVLGSSPADEFNFFYYVYGSIEKFWAPQKCAVPDEYKNLFTRQ